MELKCGNDGVCLCLFEDRLITVLSCNDGINYKDVIEYDDMDVIIRANLEVTTETEHLDSTPVDSIYDGGVIVNGDVNTGPGSVSMTTIGLLLGSIVLFIVATLMLIIVITILVSYILF